MHQCSTQAGKDEPVDTRNASYHAGVSSIERRRSIRHHPKGMIAAGDWEKNSVARRLGVRSTRDPVPSETRHHSKSRLEQVLAAHCRTRLFATLHTELLIDAADLRFHGVDGDDSRFGDLRVGIPGNQQAEHPLLLGAEWRE